MLFNKQTLLRVAHKTSVLSVARLRLTSLAVQKQLGVNQPDFSALFTNMAYDDGQEISLSRLIQPKDVFPFRRMRPHVF